MNPNHHQAGDVPLKKDRFQRLGGAFTLLEPLLAVAVIGILPALPRGKIRARGVYCFTNGRQIERTGAGSRPINSDDTANPADRAWMQQRTSALAQTAGSPTPSSP